ncbi:MAG: hypothetical protein M3257_10385 [Actinomycetota bacterium]|nr:hypothetical protein [Actinomycetota bacterium]
MVDVNNIAPRQVPTAEFGRLVAREQYLKLTSSNSFVRGCPDGSTRLPATPIEF